MHLSENFGLRRAFISARVPFQARNTFRTKPHNDDDDDDLTVLHVMHQYNEDDDN